MLATPRGLSRAALCALLLVSVGCDQGAVRVCTWNVTNLGWSFAGAKDLARMAQVIDDSCDVASLQEVKNKDGVTKLLQALHARGGSWDGTTTDKYYRGEYYGVVFRKEVAIQAEPRWRCPSVDAAKDPRPACAVLIRPNAGERPFWLIGIHVLWSQTETQREENVAALAPQIQGLLGNQAVQDRVLLGDFNVEPKNARDKWATLAKGPPAMQRLTDEQDTNITGSGTSAHYSSSYDHILLTSAHLERFTGEVVRVDPLKYAPDLADFKKNVSDHIPLSVTLFE